ncbi:hypothetical protein STUTZSP0542_14060 [Stutzerimonas marianensis]
MQRRYRRFEGARLRDPPHQQMRQFSPVSADILKRGNVIHVEALIDCQIKQPLATATRNPTQVRWKHNARRSDKEAGVL